MPWPEQSHEFAKHTAAATAGATNNGRVHDVANKTHVHCQSRARVRACARRKKKDCAHDPDGKQAAGNQVHVLSRVMFFLTLLHDGRARSLARTPNSVSIGRAGNPRECASGERERASKRKRARDKWRRVTLGGCGSRRAQGLSLRVLWRVRAEERHVVRQLVDRFVVALFDKVHAGGSIDPDVLLAIKLARECPGATGLCTAAAHERVIRVRQRPSVTRVACLAPTFVQTDASVVPNASAICACVPNKGFGARDNKPRVTAPTSTRLCASGHLYLLEQKQ